MMLEVELTKQQRAVSRRALKGSLFLEGPAGAGKTTAGAARVAHLLEKNVPASEILVMVPQRTLAAPYAALDLPPGGEISITTLGGLARRAIDLFWVLVAEDAHFAQPQQRPTFLSLETAQYYMARIIAPVIAERGFFETITINRNRLYSQIIDNLNKAAVVGFPHTEIGERLKAAWNGDDTQRRIYDEVQECATIFRQFCLSHNLLDFSLQAELFTQRLWSLPPCRAYLTRLHKHLIIDNLEEDSPAAHDILRDWLAECKSALVIYDTGAGYRRFLGSDPESAHTLKAACDKAELFQGSFVTTPDLAAFGAELALSLNRPAAVNEGSPRAAIAYENHHYHPQMIDWTAEEITRLVEQEGVPPREIVVLAPYLSDALRFALMNRLETAGIPVRSHRPSRSLREEPAAQCLLTLAQIAHPDWALKPTQFDVAYAFMTAIAGLDLIRAQLLAQIVYHQGSLHPFERILPEMRERITYGFGGRYDALRLWIDEYRAGPPEALDHFWSHIFGEVLSQPGFGFHGDYGAAEVAANLIDSARSFRWTISVPPDGKTLAQEYVEMVAGGIIANQYLRSWELDDVDAVLVAPAYTFLMRNTPVDYQFWLNIGGQGWSERLYQPLTHAYVLTRGWPVGRKWLDTDEVEVTQSALYRLALGLIHRCRQRVYLGYSELGEGGYDQRGLLLEAIQRMLRRLASSAEGAADV